MFGQAIKAVAMKPAVQKTLSPSIPTGASQLARITGTVVDTSGAPVAGATFTVDGVPITVGTTRTGITPYATDASGAFTIGRNAGKHTVQIDVPGATPTILQNLDFVVGATVDLGPIPVGAGDVKAGAASGGWWKWALGIGGGVLVVGLISFVGWKVYKKRKAPAMSDYMCRDCSYYTTDYGS